MELPFIPAERLRVFISSAQSNEGGFAWSDVRHRTKDYLMECPYLNPFIIEDSGSVSPSTQFYQRQISRADIVVLLVKGEVRKGTATEYALATKLKKPLLVYFLEEDNPGLSVVKLRQGLQSSDYCTYRAMKTFDHVEMEIRNDVIENVIRYFQDFPLHNSNADQPAESILADTEAEPSKYSTPTKTALALFSSCYDHIFDLLDIGYEKRDENTDASVLHDLGIAALNWLVTGCKLNCDEGVLKLVENVADLYSSTDWLVKRWDAIRFQLAGNAEKALAAEEQALSLAKEGNLPKWIVDDILIDCRNIDTDFHQQKDQFLIYSRFQNELNQSETIVYLPVLDRYLSDVYDGLVKEELKIQTASPNTTFYGTGIAAVINDVENYFFSALLYGSYTHMLVSRKILSRVLYKYAAFTERELLLFGSMKMLVLRGNAKDFKQFLNHEWDNVYSEVTSCADDIWALADCSPAVSKDSMKQAVLTKLGLYLSDQVFSRAEAYLEAHAADVYWGDAADYLDCIYQNMLRLNPSSVVRMITGIIKDKRFYQGYKISDIILCLKLDEVDIGLQKSLCDALVEKLPSIIADNGTPQIIAALEHQNPDVFSVLATIPKNGLTGIEKVFYDINMGNGDWNEVLLDGIQTAKRQFEENRGPGKYVSFAHAPYAMIKKVVREHFNPTMEKVIYEQFFPLCIDVLTSQAVEEAKVDCADCLCDVLVCTSSEPSKLPESLIKAVSSIDTSQCNSIMGEPKGIFACRVLMLKIIIGSAEKGDLLEWCFGYNKKSKKEKVALAECIEQFIRCKTVPSDDVDVTILSIVMQCFEDDYYIVRQRACSSLAYLLKSQFHDLVERKLYEAAMDPSHSVRSFILHLCKTGKLQDEATSNRLLDILKNDANYAIRTNAVIK